MDCLAAISVAAAPGPSSPAPYCGGGRRRVRSRGFTLLEASLAIVIVAVAFVSVMELFAACTRENQQSARVTTAQLLAANIQEMTAAMPLKDPYYAKTSFGPEGGETKEDFNDLDDFDGASINPPFDSTRAYVPELSQFTQVVHVLNVDPNNTGGNTNRDALTIPREEFTGAMRLRVIILYQRAKDDPPQEVLRSTWVRLNE